MDTDLKLVARIYSEVRRTGALDYPAWQTAVAAFRERHPAMPEREAGLEVARLIHEASVMQPDVIWDGFGVNFVPRRPSGRWH